MPSFGQILLIIFAIMVIRFFSRLWRIRSAVMERREQFMRQARNAEKQNRQEGDVNIVGSGKSASKPAKNSDEGTYVDFEEVDE